MRSTCIAVLTTLLLVAGCDRQKPASDPPKTGTAAPVVSTADPAALGPNRAPPKKPVSTDQPVEFNVTVGELRKEVKASARAAIGKYNGKRIELSGKLLSVEPSDTPQLGLWNPDDAKDGSGHVSFQVELRKSAGITVERLKALAVNQPVVVRGTVEITDVGMDLVFCKVRNADLVTIGPSPAQPTTVRAVQAEFNTPAGRKNEAAAVEWIIRAKVLTNEKHKQWGHVLVITDPGMSEPVVRAHGLLQDAQWTEMKPGAEIIIIGQFQIVVGINATTPVLHNARILTAPPEGVVLPEPAKK